MGAMKHQSLFIEDRFLWPNADAQEAYASSRERHTAQLSGDIFEPLKTAVSKEIQYL